MPMHSALMVRAVRYPLFMIKPQHYHFRYTILMDCNGPTTSCLLLPTGEVIGNLILLVWFKQIKVQPFIYKQSLCMDIHHFYDK